MDISVEQREKLYAQVEATAKTAGEMEENLLACLLSCFLHAIHNGYENELVSCLSKFLTESNPYFWEEECIVGKK